MKPKINTTRIVELALIIALTVPIVAVILALIAH